jgi:hypothetical protein
VNVRQLIDQLEDYGDHLDVHVEVDGHPDGDYVVDSVEGSTVLGGVPVVVLYVTKDIV